jgi:hypothetical protein
VVLRIGSTSYSISVWINGPNAYPIIDNGTLQSADVSGQIARDAGKWFENNEANFFVAVGAVAAVCVDVATLGTATPVTTAVLVAAIVAAAGAGAKLAVSSAANP